MQSHQIIKHLCICLLGLLLLGFGKTTHAKHNPQTIQSKQTDRQTNTSDVKIKMDISHSHILTNTPKRVYIKVGLQGGNPATKRFRTPINLAVVLDQSTSMQGVKLQKAKEAAKMVLELLQPNDIISLITYDSTVQVLVPASKVTQTTKRFVQQKIKGIRAKGMTALFGGVSKGIAEVKKYLSNTRINRVVLLSDGQANIGPNSPNALARLGIASARQGISISTVGLGLGYNEDLMTKLANKSDGNHGYAKNASDLARIFQNEMGNLLSVVAQHIDIKMTFASGIKPIRVLDSQLKPLGQTLRIKWNQLYAKQNKFVIVEVEIPKGKKVSLATVAQMHVTYRNTDGIQHAKQSVTLQRTNQEALCQNSKKRSLLIEVAEAKGNEAMRKAMKLRDKGKYLQARKLFVNNSIYLKRLAKQFKSRKLKRFSLENDNNSKALRGYKWRRARKRIRSSLYKRQNKQTW